MQVTHGTTRTVYIGTKYVMKVPIIKMKRALGTIPDTLRSLYLHIKRTKTIKGISLCFGPFRSFGEFGGFFENLRELSFSRKLGDLVTPAKLSLFGIVSFMEKGMPCSIPTLVKEFNSLFPGQRHTFDNPSHFVWHKGKIKLCDYGNRSAAMFLLENKEKCRAFLDKMAEKYNKTQPPVT